MPIIKSAKKKLRGDLKKTRHNRAYENSYKSAIKKVKKKSISLSKVYAWIDKAAKRGVIHKNKASRLKSKIASKK